MIKTMTNGEYLPMCKAHGVAPVYLDEKPKQRRPKAQLYKTTGDGFVLVTPTEKPKPKKSGGKPHNKRAYQLTPYDQERLASKAKKPKKKRSKRHRRSHDSIAAAAPLRSPTFRSIYTVGHLTTVSGGLPGLGKRR
jgi:hypothetical protein